MLGRSRLVLGTALLVGAAVALPWFLLGLWASGFAEVEAHVPADGAPHQVTVEPGEERLLWTQEYNAADCQIRDIDRDDDVTLRSPGGTYNRFADNYDGGVWGAEASFDSGSGRLAVTCVSTRGPAEIGPVVDAASVVVGLLTAIALPLALAVAGLVTLRLTGPRRSRSG